MVEASPVPTHLSVEIERLERIVAEKRGVVLTLLKADLVLWKAWNELLDADEALLEARRGGEREERSGQLGPRNI